MPLKKSKKVWMDGKFVDWDDAKIHVCTHVIHYGTAVFEGIRCYKTKKGTAVFSGLLLIISLLTSSSAVTMTLLAERAISMSR